MPDKVRVYPYRWAVLAAFMAVNLTIQTLWISYAPISSTAQEYFGVSSAAIGVLAISFMLAYLPFSFVASQLITHRGFRFAAGLGALLAGVSGVVRGLVGAHYVLVLLATIGAAIAQPFLLNAWTTISTQWFPKSQRATAVSLITLANLFGVAVGMVVTPTLVESISVSAVQLVYGAAALVAGIAFVLIARDRPPTPPDVGPVVTPTPALVGVRQALSVRPFAVFLGVAFVAMGVFNGLSTWIEEIVKPRGFTSVEAGSLGALLLLGGILGALVISALSDWAQRRVPFLALSLAVSAPALLWMTFANSLLGLMCAAFLLGFFMTSAMPVGMQYSAEITVPVPEGTSNGLIQLGGQTSVIVVYLMAVTRTSSGSFVPSMCALAVLLLVCGVVVSRLPEPAVHFSLSTGVPAEVTLGNASATAEPAPASAAASHIAGTDPASNSAHEE